MSTVLIRLEMDIVIDQVFLFMNFWFLSIDHEHHPSSRTDRGIDAPSNPPGHRGLGFGHAPFVRDAPSERNVRTSTPLKYDPPDPSKLKTGLLKSFVKGSTLKQKDIEDSVREAKTSVSSERLMPLDPRVNSFYIDRSGSPAHLGHSQMRPAPTPGHRRGEGAERINFFSFSFLSFNVATSVSGTPPPVKNLKGKELQIVRMNNASSIPTVPSFHCPLH